MGIQGLIPFLDKGSSRINISQYKDCCVAVDAYCWLHKGAYTCAEKLARGEKCDAYVFYCMKYVNMLLSHNIKPILVFDGRHLPAKAGTEKKRRESRVMNRKTATELLNAGRVDEARNYLRRCVDVTHAMALALIQECRKINVDCIVAPYEADAQLAYLNLQNIAQVVITEDSDLILFGCSKIVFKLDLQGNGLLVERDRLHLSMGVRAENFNFDSFRYMCILSGCDYLPSLPGIGLNKALKFINKTKDPDIHRALRRMPGYLNMTQLKVSEEYRNSFVSADATFRYQPVFDPQSRCLVPLTDPPEGEVPPTIVNEHLSPNVAFHLALGNLDPFTLERVDNFNPDCPLQGVASLQRRRWGSSVASAHPSIWLRDFPGFQPVPEKSQFPGMLNCSAVLDVTPLHKNKNPLAGEAEADAEEHVLPSSAELESMYGSNGSPIHHSKKVFTSSIDTEIDFIASNASEHNANEMSISFGEEKVQQEQPTSPILHPRRSRNPFAKPKQISSPGAMGRPNYFSALRKFDGIYPMEINSFVVVSRSSESADKTQPPNPEMKTEVVLKDVSNTNPEVSTQNNVPEEKMFAGYSCEKENSHDLSSCQDESIIAAMEAIQRKVGPSFQTEALQVLTAGKDERQDASAVTKMEVDVEDISRQQGDSKILPKSPFPSFNWGQFKSKRSLSSSKLTCSQAVSSEFKNPFQKKSVSTCIGRSQQVIQKTCGVKDTEPQLTSTAPETTPEVNLGTQELSEHPKSPPKIASFLDENFSNSTQVESRPMGQSKYVPDTFTITAGRPSSGGASARTLVDEVGPLENSPWKQDQETKEELETENQPLSCGSNDSGYQGSQGTLKSSWQDIMENPVAHGQYATSKRRLGLKRSSAIGPAPPKQNLLAQYGFSKKRKLSLSGTN